MIKKISAFFLAIIIIMSCVVVAYAVSNETEILTGFGYSLGDVNMDKTVNVKDATTLQKHLAGIAALDEQQLVLADADQNSSVNIKDATYIQKQVAGLVPPAEFKPSVTAPDTEASNPTVSESESEVVSSLISSSAPVTTDVVFTSVSETTTPSETVTSSEIADVTIPTATSVPETSTTITTEIPTVTITEAPTEKPTRDPNKPIELPFVPAK